MLYPTELRERIKERIEILAIGKKQVKSSRSADKNQAFEISFNGEFQMLGFIFTLCLVARDEIDVRRRGVDRSRLRARIKLVIFRRDTENITSARLNVGKTVIACAVRPRRASRALWVGHGDGRIGDRLTVRSGDAPRNRHECGSLKRRRVDGRRRRSRDRMRARAAVRPRLENIRLPVRALIRRIDVQ